MIRVVLAWGLVFGLMACVGCTGGNDEGASGPMTAGEVLDAAQARLGTAEALEGYATLKAGAFVQGPEGEFATVVWSGRDGRARLEQTGGVVIGAHPDGNWMLDGEGNVHPLDPQGLTFLRGHELHAIVLDPESRYTRWELREDTVFLKQAARVVTFFTDRGDSVTAYFSKKNNTWLGMRMTPPDPPVVITFSDWEEVDGLNLFTTALFRQGSEEYRYRYAELRVNGVPDSTFAQP